MTNNFEFEFHKNNIEDLVEDGNILINLPNFPNDNLDQYYGRKVEMGWWMPIKQILIRDYIDYYLAILAKNLPWINLYFFDLMSSWGMNRITKNQGKDEFIFPGTSLNAALISSRSKKKFDKIFANDLEYRKRIVLNKRLESMSELNGGSLDLEINMEEYKIDSNQWIIDAISSIKNINSNYLMVIDNEGMDIEYNTLRKIIEIDHYGDIIITFQNNIARTIKQSPEKARRFFGRPIKEDEINREKLGEIYVNQLKGLELKIEQIKIESGIGFYYTLIFCCRSDVSGKWFRRYKEYREKQYRNLTGENLKILWDRATGKTKGMDDFF